MTVPRPLALLLTVALAVVLVVAAYSLASSGPSSASASATVPADVGVSVSGVGRASGTPDVLRITIGVQTSAAAVDAALTEANGRAAAVVAALKEGGVAPADLQTASVQVYPQYDDKGRAIVGYSASNDVRADLRDLAGAGALLGRAVTAGGDSARLASVQFVLDDDTAVLATARDSAFADARAKAEQYARLAGLSLGALISVQENVATTPPPYPQAASSASAKDSAVPLEAGSSEVSVVVDARWELR